MSQSSIDLPQELVDEIISHLGCPALDTATLVSSSLVCRSWLTPSRRILLQRVSLTKKNVDGLKELLASNPDLGFYIRGIKVQHSSLPSKGAHLWLNSVSWILGQVQRLERLSMSDISWPAADEDTKAYFRDQLSHVLPTVTHLTLRRVLFTDRLDLEHFILAFPNLKSVVCSAANWARCSSPTQFRNHLRLQNPPITSIRWKSGFRTEVLDTLCQNPDTKLEAFGLNMQSSAEVPRLCNLLQLNKTSLRKLSLRGMHYTMVELDRVLQRTTIPLGLDRLTLGDATADIETNRWMLSTILALGTPSLRSLTLRVIVDGRYVGNDIDWNELDRILSNNNTFKALTTLNVICLYWDRRLENLARDPAILTSIKVLMPSMSSRPGFEILCFGALF